ncbi:hypothetical protein Q7P37_011233 [Cladosporium fusiforme]
MRGGTYDPSSSTTVSEDLGVVAAGGDPSDTQRTEGTHIWYNDWTKDTITAGYATLEAFPIGMAGFDFGGIFDTQPNIGLGRNSTLLNALRDAKKISSRTYSFCEVMGPNITQKLQPSSVGCESGMYVTVTNMILAFPNGTKADMLAPSTLSACVRLDYPAISSPRYDPFMERFEAHTGTSHAENIKRLPWDVPAYRLAGYYGGDLTMVLDQGLRFTSSNDILILPSESVGSDGAYERNSSALGIQLTPTLNVNINDVPHIGRPFFSAAYIMVDLDSETWTLWQANATTDSRLVRVGSDCIEDQRPEEPVSNGTIIDDAVNSGSSTSGSDASAGASATITTGAIIGVAIGAAFGTGLVAAAITIFILKKRRRKERSGSESAFALTRHSPESEQRVSIWHEKPADSVQELSALRVYNHELPVDERAVEAPGGPWDHRPFELSATQTPKP